jgi:hypothetical protein
MNQAYNPYEAPQSNASNDYEPSDVETIRKKYLSHEASIKSVGSLYIIGCILSLFGIVPSFIQVIRMGLNGEAVFKFFITLLLLLLVILQFTVAIGLLRLKNIARLTAIPFSVLGLLLFPIGTIVAGYILYLLLSKKGAYVVSPEYHQIIQMTPHIKYKTSIVVWIFFVAFLLLIGLAIIGSMIGG